ncbi:MAG: GGDEF domain-containing protein [Patescibacteria group bacterium]
MGINWYWLVIVAQMVAILYLVYLLSVTVKRSQRDPLTGLYNRETLKETFQKLQGSKKRFSLMILDIDHFKYLNDSCGHVIGDEVLKGVSGRIAGNIRPQDSSFRYGGEEFLVILPDTGEDEAVIVARRLQEKLRQPYRLRQKFSEGLNVTVSMGISVSTKGDSPEDVLDRADKALYRAKKAGRDRIVFDQQKKEDRDE